MMLSETDSRVASNDTGSVLVESAISIPVLLLVLFGIVQYGLILSAELTLRNAAAVGVREAALFSSKSCSDIEAAISGAVSAMLPTSGIVSYPKSKVLTDAYKVGVTYDLPLVIPFVVPGSSGGKMTLSADAVMRPQAGASSCAELT